MPKHLGRAVALAVIALLVWPLSGPATSATTGQPLLALRGPGTTMYVDPVTGTLRFEIGLPGELTGGVASSSGTVYASTTDATGRGTNLFRVSPGSRKPVQIGQVTGRALLTTMDPDGTSLLLLQYSRGGPPEIPRGVVAFPLQSGQEVTQPRHALRDLGGGILTPEGSRWYGLVTILDQHGKLVRSDLHMVSFAAGKRTNDVVIPLRVSSYSAMLLSPDRRTLFIVDFGDGWTHHQTIHVLDVSGIRPIQRQTFPLDLVPRKATRCEAALSPDGTRLFVVTGDLDTELHTAHGIDIYDTATWRHMTRLAQDQPFYCLTPSTDGDMLYAATSQDELFTFNTKPYEPSSNVILDIGGAVPPYLLFATA